MKLFVSIFPTIIPFIMLTFISCKKSENPKSTTLIPYDITGVRNLNLGYVDSNKLEISVIGGPDADSGVLLTLQRLPVGITAAFKKERIKSGESQVITFNLDSNARPGETELKLIAVSSQGTQSYFFKIVLPDAGYWTQGNKTYRVMNLKTSKNTSPYLFSEFVYYSKSHDGGKLAVHYKDTLILPGDHVSTVLDKFDFYAWEGNVGSYNAIFTNDTMLLSKRGDRFRIVAKKVRVAWNGAGNEADITVNIQ